MKFYTDLKGQYLKIPDEHLADLNDGKYEIVIKPYQERTMNQNAALHLWCGMLADELNNNNFLIDMGKVGRALQLVPVDQFIGRKDISNYIVDAHSDSITHDDLKLYIFKIVEQYVEFSISYQAKQRVKKRWTMELVKDFIIKPIIGAKFPHCKNDKGVISTTKLKKHEDVDKLVEIINDYFDGKIEVPEFPHRKD